MGIAGVIVLGVVSGSPAERAGLRGLGRAPAGLTLGDVIVGVAGKRVQSYDDLYNTLDARKAGERVKVEIARAGARVEAELELTVVE
jgi:S1-C subfamily serine protease